MKKYSFLDVVIHFIFIVFCIMCIVPFVIVIATSFSTEAEVVIKMAMHCFQENLQRSI